MKQVLKFKSISDKLQEMTQIERRLIMKEWGTETANLLKSRAESQGGRRLWSTVARSVRMISVSDAEVKVFVSPESKGTISDVSAVALFRETGGTIKAKNHKFLAVPLNDDAKKKPPRAMGDLFILKTAEKAFLAQKTPAGRKIKMMYLLVHKVTQKARPWLPTDDEVLQMGQKIVEEKAQ